MKTKRKSSIFLKTQIYLSIFCVGILLFIWCGELIYFAYKYRAHQTSVVKDIALEIDRATVIDHEKIESLAYQNNVCITVIAGYGEIANYNTKMNGCRLLHPETRDYIYSFLLSEQSSKSIRVEYQDEQEGFLYAVKNGEMDIFVYSPLEDTNLSTTIMRGQLIYLILVAIVLSFGVSIFLSNLLTKQIRTITKKAANIGKENYQNYFEETGITELDELSNTLNTVQEELNKVQSYQKDLLANVSHDLKTPLTMIRAYAEKIRDLSYKDKNKLDNDTQIIIDEADRLTLLVNDILNLSKLENQVETLNLVEYDLVKEIKEVLKKYEIIRETENYEFVVNMPKKLMITADKGKINQVIYNLLNNAINYTGKDKKVYVTVRSLEKNISVEIKDTGKGIKESEINKIWTKYYKNDKNHRRNVVGTGIGLSIVKEILENHNFEYGVVSKNRKGSTFYFVIPKGKKKKGD